MAILFIKRLKGYGGSNMPTWIEVIIRTLVAVVILFLITKMLGKRQVSQLSLFEYITGITIGSLAAYVSLELDSSWHLGIISLLVWGGVSLGIEFLQLKSKKARDLIDGKATVLIQKGKILEDELKKERITTDELLELLRKKDVFQVADVEFAVMEPSGDMSVLLKKENRPLTAKDLDITVGSEDEPKTVIMDGKMMSEGLLASGFQQEWIHRELEKLGVELEEVFLGQVDSMGQLQIDLYDDQLEVPKRNQALLLLATLKQCEADLTTFALSTQNEIAKDQYEYCARRMNQVVKEVSPYLKR